MIEYCKICGWPSEKYRHDAGIYDFGDICECCGFHLGVDDKVLEHVRFHREIWIQNGAKWSCAEFKPSDWNLEEQLASIPEEWR